MSIDLGSSPTPPNAAPTEAEKTQIRNSLSTSNKSWIIGDFNTLNSGDASLICGYSNSNNRGNYSIVGGYNNDYNLGESSLLCGNSNGPNYGASSLIMGSANGLNSGYSALVAGENNEGNAGSCSLIFGEYAAYNKFGDALIQGGGMSARRVSAILTKQTLDNTPTPLTIGGAAENASNRLFIENNTAWAFTINAIAANANKSSVQSFTRRGLITNNNGSTILVGSESIGTDFSYNGLSGAIILSADNTYDTLVVTASGIATTLDWTASVDLVQVGLHSTPE